MGHRDEFIQIVVHRVCKVPLRGFQRPGLTLVQFAAQPSASLPLLNLLAKPPSRSGCSKPPLGCP